MKQLDSQQESKATKPKLTHSSRRGSVDSQETSILQTSPLQEIIAVDSTLFCGEAEAGAKAANGSQRGSTWPESRWRKLGKKLQVCAPGHLRENRCRLFKFLQTRTYDVPPTGYTVIPTLHQRFDSVRCMSICSFRTEIARSDVSKHTKQRRLQMSNAVNTGLVTSTIAQQQVPGQASFNLELPCYHKYTYVG